MFTIPSIATTLNTINDTHHSQILTVAVARVVAVVCW